jgi:glycosyltransferase involved in cell wall biosynthesis
MSKNKSIRVLHLLKNFEIGGVETSTIRFANYLSDKIEFIGIFAGFGCFFEAKTLNSKIKVFINEKNLYSIIDFIFIIFKLYKICKSNKINIVHYHFRIYIPYIYSLKILFPKLQITYTHHNNYKDKISYLIFANKYLAIGTSPRDDLDSYSLLKRNIEIMPNGINIIDEIEKQNNFPKINLGIIGRIEELKGIKFIVLNLIKIFKIDDNIQVVFKGNGSLIDLIKSCDFFNKKIFLQQFTNHNIVSLYSDIDILIVPSIAVNNLEVEGIPMVILEAMAYEIPIIASDIGGIKDIITDKINGLLFESGNILSLIEKIKLLLQNNDLRQLIIKNGKQTVVKNYSLQTNTEKLISIYSNLL